MGDLASIIVLVIFGLLVAVSIWAAVCGYRDRQLIKEQVNDWYCDDDVFNSDDPFFNAITFLFWGAVVTLIIYGFIWWQFGFSGLSWHWGTTCLVGIVPFAIASIHWIFSNADSLSWIDLLCILAGYAIGYLIGQILWPLLVLVVVAIWIWQEVRAGWAAIKGKGYEWLASGTETGD